MKLRFAGEAPAVPAGAPVWIDVEIGREYTVVESVDEDGNPVGVIEYVLDDAGKPKMRSHRLPVAVTARHMIDAVARVQTVLNDHGWGDDGFAAGVDAAEVRYDLWVGLMGAMLTPVDGTIEDGFAVVAEIANDVTVSPQEFEELCGALIDMWGFGQIVDDYLAAIAKGTDSDPPS